MIHVSDKDRTAPAKLTYNLCGSRHIRNHGNKVGCRYEGKQENNRCNRCTVLQAFCHYRPHMKFGKGNAFIGVCHSVHKVVCLYQHASLVTWPRSLPPGAGGGVGGGSASWRGKVCIKADPLPWDTVNKWAVCILLECILVQLFIHFNRIYFTSEMHWNLWILFPPLIHWL